VTGFDCLFWRDGCPMDKNKVPAWDASDKVLQKAARPSAAQAAAMDKLPARLRWLILIALTLLSWALIGVITIAVVAVVHHLQRLNV
jgi:hypothetical protein